MSAQIIILPSGRPVLNTGKVLIGLRHSEPPATPRVLDWGSHRPPLSLDAERLQAAMLCGGTNDERPRPSTPSQPPSDWLDDEELQLELARKDAEALEWLASRSRRLVWSLVALAAFTAVAWWLA